MKIGFICLNLPRHLNPMTALARQLQARNHEVVFLYASSANGLPCVPGQDSDPFNENRPEVSRLEGDDALAFAIALVAQRTEAILESMPAMLAATGVDALIIDTIQFYAELAPMKLGIPYIQVAVALHFDYSGYTPLGIYGDPHQTTPEAIARNRKGVARFAKMLGNDNIKSYAKNAGFKIDWKDPGFTYSKIAWLTQTPSEFDFENSRWPSHFHHTGPFYDGKGREEVEFPEEE
jgi:zeaxanthin glucosyltransferase